MSDSEFRWMVVIALWCLVVIQLGIAVGLDALLKPMNAKLDEVIHLLRSRG